MIRSCDSRSKNGDYIIQSQLIHIFSHLSASRRLRGSLGDLGWKLGCPWPAGLGWTTGRLGEWGWMVDMEMLGAGISGCFSVVRLTYFDIWIDISFSFCSLRAGMIDFQPQTWDGAPFDPARLCHQSTCHLAGSGWDTAGWPARSIFVIFLTPTCLPTCLALALPACLPVCLSVCLSLSLSTSSTAQGGGGSFKNRKPIGEVGCCESGMAERSHWLTERWLELCLLEWLQWLQWSPHPQLLDVVWCTATVVVVVA